jgi:hypothetical protein
MALGLIGGEAIVSLTADSEASRKCALYLDQAVAEVLRAYPWNCATRLATLAPLSETPAMKYSYAYSLPAGCLRALWGEYTDIKFKITGAKLLCNESSMKLEYIALIGVSEMDSLCCSALIAKLAAYLAFALTNSATMQKSMEGLYEKALLKAAIADAQEGTPEEIDVEEFLNARY